MKNRHKTSNLTIQTILVSTICTLVVSIVIIGALVYKFEPVTTLSHEVAVSSKLSSETPKTIVELAQSGIYEVVISFLIFTNSVIAGLSVWYIKTISQDKAEELVEVRVKQFFNRGDYRENITKSMNDEGMRYLKSAQENFDEYIEDFGNKIDTIKNIPEVVTKLTLRCEELERQIKIMAHRIAQLDKEDSEGDDLELKWGKH